MSEDSQVARLLAERFNRPGEIAASGAHGAVCGA